MGVILKVGDKEVLSTEITYDDLVVLYRQFIETYNIAPKSRFCDLAHNMPQRRIINRVLQTYNITHDEFVKQFDFDPIIQKKPYKHDKQLAIEKQCEYYKTQFPITISDITYSLFEDITVCHKDNMHNTYYLPLIDNFGYKYNYSYNAVMNAKKSGKQLNRFFKWNKYTYDNINLFCKLNNIDLQIDGTGLPTSGYARENIPFVDSAGNTVYTNWNVIQNRKLKYRTSDEQIKVKNRICMSKEKAIPIIKNMQASLNRPLLQSDFEGVETTDNSIGIRVVWRLWGTFNNMIDELGLIKHDAYYRPNDKYYVPHEDIINSVKIVCDDVKKTGRNIIMYPDFKRLVNIDVSTIRRHCELDNTTLNDLIKQYGCELQQAGNGLNYKFEDGEKTVSKFEYDFSIFLRNNKLVYNKDYFRNIYYKELDSKYNGNMNCDYLLILNGHKIYIELAGILGNSTYQEAYRNNTPIKSKSKEMYRQKLYQKRDIFERNNLEYYILLPDEMNIDTYKNILNKYLKEAA